MTLLSCLVAHHSLYLNRNILKRPYHLNTQNLLHKLVYNNPEHFKLPVDPTMKIVENNSESFVNILASNFFCDFFFDFFLIVVRCIQRRTNLNLPFCPWRVYTEQR